jgi:ABC-2 type transport system permease protein
MASGCYFPIEFIPENVRKISFLFPQTWVLDIFKKYQTSSVTIDKLYINIITLIAFAVTMLLIASFRMKFSNKEMTALND